jgi:hypothetical protein
VKALQRQAYRILEEASAKPKTVAQTIVVENVLLLTPISESISYRLTTIYL